MYSIGKIKVKPPVSQYVTRFSSSHEQIDNYCLYLQVYSHIQTDTVSLEQVILMYIGCVLLANTNFHISELHLPQTNNQRLALAKTGGNEASVVHLQHYQTFYHFQSTCIYIKY